MKKVLFYLFFALALTATSTSCNKPEEPDPVVTETKITLLTDTVRIGCEGGVATIDYTISASIEDASIQVTPNPETAWLNDFDTSIEGRISFNVSEHTETTPREAEVSVTYADAQASFTVLQDAAVKEETPAFEITISEIAQDSVKINIIPEDPDITYLLGVTTSNALNTYPDDETFIGQFLIPYYTELAASYGVSLSDYLSQALMRGEASGSVKGLSAETDYIAFCFGLTSEAEVTTEMVTQSFKTLAFGDFNATIEVEVVEADATVTVTPEDDTQGYLTAIFEGKGHNIEDINASLQDAAELYPEQLSSAAGKCMLPATYQVEGEWYGIWHGIFVGDLSGYSDEELYAGTKYSGFTWLDATVINLLDYNETYTAVGFVETEDGNYGELYMVTFTTSEDGCSPISEFDSSVLDGLSPYGQEPAAAPALRLPEKANNTDSAVIPQTKVQTDTSTSQTYQVGEESASTDNTDIIIFSTK